MSQRESALRFFSFGFLRKQLFHLPLEEVSFARRAFRGVDNQARQRLELIGATFLWGYHLALEETDLSILTQRLNSVDLELRGFSFEGAAMGLALFDLLTPWKKDRWRLFLKKGGAPHKYMMHVGAGWALAQLPWFQTHPALVDPLLGWLVIDGYGFHRGYFQWPRYVVEQKLPKRLSPYAQRVFDQGLGRSLWFVDGADVSRIPATIASFDPARQGDLWSGIGLACTYAGGVDAVAIKALQSAARRYSSQLAQGAAFAAKTRQRAGNQVEHTDLACRIFCGLSADAAAAITDEALKDLSIDRARPPYQVWRERIQQAFAGNSL